MTMIQFISTQSKINRFLLTLIPIIAIGIYCDMKKSQSRSDQSLQQQISITRTQRESLIKSYKTNSELNQQITKTEVDYRKSLRDTIIYLNPKLDSNIITEYVDGIHAASIKWNIPFNLIACIIMRESGFDKYAISSKGAKGCMQIMMGVHSDKLEERNLSEDGALTISHNIDIGCEILFRYLKPDNNIFTALKRYVGGSHDTYATDILTLYIQTEMN